MASLEVEFYGLKFKNPIVVASIEPGVNTCPFNSSGMRAITAAEQGSGEFFVRTPFHRG